MPQSYIFELIFLLYLILASALAFVLIYKKQRRWLAIILILSVLGIIYSGYLEPNWLKVRQESIAIGKLNQPLRIALVSDWHFRPFKGKNFVKRVAEKIQEQKPDLILMTGDFLFHDDIDFFRDDLATLAEVAKLAPTYAVLGNHDFGVGNRRRTILFPDQHQALREILERAGLKVLIDEQELVKIKGEELWLAGFKEFWSEETNPSAALQGLADDVSSDQPAGRLKIGLSHNPDAAFLPESQVLDIVLSGHTHGGQIRLPWFGSVALTETDLPRADYGRLLLDRQPKIVNTVGLGEAGPHLRFWNRPEIMILTIH